MKTLRIVVGLDGSVHGETALAWARAEAALVRTHARSALSVCPLRPIGPPVAPYRSSKPLAAARATAVRAAAS
jgi:hypothetical protein